MAARSAPRGHLCRRSCYCVEQVEAIIRTEATWRFWLPIGMPEPPDAELPLAELPLPVVLPPAVDPVALLPLVEPDPLGEPLAAAPVEPGELDAAMSEPITST